MAFDPLDGSSIVDTNFTVGTIFGVYPGDKFLGKTGRDQVCFTLPTPHSGLKRLKAQQIWMSFLCIWVRLASGRGRSGQVTQRAAQSQSDHQGATAPDDVAAA